MGDWAPTQDYNRVTITTAHEESLGGALGSMGITSAATAWPAANRAIFVPFIVHSPLTVVKMFVLVGAAAGNIDVGIYDTGQNRLVSAGSTAMAGASALQIFDVTDTLLQAGVYYFAVATDGTTGTLQAFVPVVPICAGNGVLSQSTAFALPNPATFAAAQDAYIPLVGLTARTTV